MKRSDSLDQLLPALITARSAMPRIGKDQTAEIESERGRGFSYSYAGLSSVLEAITPALCANGLALVQPFSVIEGAVVVETTLFHSSGQWIAAEPLALSNGSGGPRAIGAAATYARRYQLLALLSLSPSGEDDDGEAAERPARGAARSRTPTTSPRRTTEPSADRKPTLAEVDAARARLETAAGRGMATLIPELNITPQSVRAALGVDAINALRSRAKQTDSENAPA